MSWVSRTLGEVCDEVQGLIQTGPFGSQLHESDYQNEGIPVIMPQDIVAGRVNVTTVARIKEEKASQLRRHKVSEGTIVMPRRGEISKRAFITKAEDGFLCGTGCIKIEMNDYVLFPRFLYYFLEQLQVSQWIEQHAVGTTMLNLNTTIIRNIPILYPIFERQERIAGILSAYDDLIENNQRRIALLEESARLLYREWFVRLRFPGHEHTRIIDGVPERWDKGTTYDVMDVLSGGTPKTSAADYWGGKIPFFTPKDAVRTAYVIDTEKTLTNAGLSKCNSKLYPRDTLFITARGTVGKLNLAQRPMAMNQSCYALLGKGRFSQLFLYCALQETIAHFQQQAAGAVFDAIVVDTFRKISFIVPSARLLDLFQEFVQPIFRQSENLLLQNQKLRTARDLLLPRLMSGEIEV
jgi:type I restriction enzyme, S subunit